MINILLYLMAVVVLAIAAYAFFVLSSYKKTLKELEETKEKLNSAKHHDETDYHFRLKVGSELEKSAQEARAEIRGIGRKLGAELRETLKGNVESIDKAAEEAVALEFDRVRAEITEYKRQKLSEVDAKAKTILSEVVEEALARSLTEADKQNLVIKALDDAKRRNLF